MGDDDKPFACPQPGCGMRFVNEDHLSVHKLKHEMSLTLTPGTRVAGNLFVDFSTDQTPTPTKFLRTCEEIGLFSELNPSKNPFEDAFKKAAMDNMSHVPTDVHHLVSIDGGTLNTPIPQADSSQPQPEYIPLPGPTSDSGSTLGSNNVSPLNLNKQDTEMAIDLRMSSASVIIPAAPTLASTHSRAPSERIKVTHDETMSPVDVEHTPPPESEDDLSIISSSSMPAHTSAEEETHSTGERFVMARTQQVLVTSQDMVTSPSMTPQMVTSPMNAQGGITIAAPMTAAAMRPQYVMQVMLQLPGGQTVPVQIPAAIGQGPSPGPNPGPSTLASPPTSLPAGPATVHVLSHQVMPHLQVKTEPQPQPAPAPVPQVVTTTALPPQIPQPAGMPAVTLPGVTATEVSTTSSAQSTASAITKQKLKAAITQNVQQSVLQNNMRVMTEAVERVIASPAQRPQTLLKTTPGGGVLIHSQPPSLISSPTTLHAVQTQAADTSTPFANKRSRKSTDEDPDERRRKFLERNRAAAARCRFKRKQWITNLERKADDINGVSLKLQTEINQLRAEVAQLKSLLLAHKDCPIFVQQRNSGQINLETVSVQKVEVGSEGEQVCVPTKVTTLNVGSMSQPGVSTSAASVTPATATVTAQHQAMTSSDMTSQGGATTIISVTDDSHNKIIATLS